jgi:hypothetical protein
MVAKKTSLFASLARLWDMLRQNYIFYAWNLLLDAGIISSPQNATTTPNESSSRRDKGRDSSNTSSKKEVIIMHAIDQFIISQHRSMKLLQGGSIISFMETSILESASPSSPSSHDQNHPHTREAVFTHSLYENNTIQDGAARRSLLQQGIKPLDQSIRVYSSIITATKGYQGSKEQIGKNQITDSWLQGPLRWPPK